MQPHSDPRFEADTLRGAWPSLVWIVFAAILAVTALMLAPVPN
jgi:hypothetical protein